MRLRYLHPKPNWNLKGSCTLASSCPSFKNCSGENESGFGYATGSRDIALQIDVQCGEITPKGNNVVPNVRDEDRTGWYPETLEFLLLGRRMGNGEGEDGVPSQTLFQHRVDVRQRIAVGEVGETIRADDGVEFGLSSALVVRELDHREEECR